MALQSSSRTYVLAIDLLCGGCFVFPCLFIFMCVDTCMSTDAAVYPYIQRHAYIGLYCGPFPTALWGIIHMCFQCDYFIVKTFTDHRRCDIVKNENFQNIKDSDA